MLCTTDKFMQMAECSISWVFLPSGIFKMTSNANEHTKGINERAETSKG
jgi:hypothetical protein